jgi:pimeloyl-ACP methyl ester carboxylesterase
LFALAFARDMPKGSMSDGMFLSVVCAEDIPRVTPDDIVRESAGNFIGTTMFDTQMKPCAFWPRGTVTDDYYAPVTSDRPALIFSGADDPVTPPSWGDHVAEHLSHAKHFVVPGAGHITLTRGCVPEIVAAFLTTASVDHIDGDCLAALARPPFFTGYTSPGRQ